MRVLRRPATLVVGWSAGRAGHRATPPRTVADASPAGRVAGTARSGRGGADRVLRGDRADPSHRWGRLRRRVGRRGAPAAGADQPVTAVERPVRVVG
ncbi:hypothetical protein [Micromonospora sp. SH-82]|uniref:hypothetical protein n=1 Tax=Micromonospora sp. SH-82 TaxID=3132938 RepID=UPI003EB9688B